MFAGPLPLPSNAYGRWTERRRKASAKANGKSPNAQPPWLGAATAHPHPWAPRVVGAFSPLLSVGSDGASSGGGVGTGVASRTQRRARSQVDDAFKHVPSGSHPRSRATRMEESPSTGPP